MGLNEMLFPNLAGIEKAVFYLHDGTYNERSILGIGIEKQLKIQHAVPNTFELLNVFLNQEKWKIGYIGYDAKNAVEKLKSPILDPQEKPCLYFVIPEIILSIEKGQITVLQGKNNGELNQIIDSISTKYQEGEAEEIELTPRINKHQYLHAIEQVQKHIQQGDIYELNFCQEFYANEAKIDPFDVYFKLHKITKAPFSTFLKWSEHSLMCASPERFLSQNGNALLSQPIKGTIRRGKNAEEDKKLVEQLKNDPKERSENIMITDLVRNDLSKSAEKGSVEVTELCEIYSFETVHQMISTVVAKKKAGVTNGQVIKNLFPMGSMTGAPKVRAMQLIDQLESTSRGLYSGAVGYVDPEGNFDFNVVIRSLMYNEQKKYLSALVGGAITAASIPEKEYEECLLKAEALFQSLMS